MKKVTRCPLELFHITPIAWMNIQGQLMITSAIARSLALRSQGTGHLSRTMLWAWKQGSRCTFAEMCDVLQGAWGRQMGVLYGGFWLGLSWLPVPGGLAQASQGLLATAACPELGCNWNMSSSAPVGPDSLDIVLIDGQKEKFWVFLASGPQLGTAVCFRKSPIRPILWFYFKQCTGQINRSRQFLKTYLIE